VADKTAKWAQNKPGKFYVDDQCIACDACVVEASEFFEMNDEDGHAYVKKQPQEDNKEEQKQCMAALEACPVEAIGSDGE